MAGASEATGTIVVIGGGAAGVLVTAHLLLAATGPIDIVVVEPGSSLGTGVAYSTEDERHLLNSPVREMSAFSDEPSHFLAGASTRNLAAGPEQFLPRRVYGDYLRDVLTAARRAPGALGGVEWVREEAVAVRPCSRPGASRFLVGLARGGHLAADEVVLAVGPPPPRAPWAQAVGAPGDPRLIPDPWAPGALERIDARSRVLLVGTGLTMVDVALSLGRAEHGRMLHARSRHGLVPERHCGSTTTGWEGKVEPATTARELMRSIRVAVNKAEFAGDDWRAVVAGVRRQVPELWSALAVEERRRLCRHALRYWEIHRHRMAPAVVAELDRVRSAGRLDVGRGRLGAIDVSGDKLRAHLTGGDQGDELLEVEAVVNCTGPSGERTGGSRLLTSLIDSGLARADAIGMGVDTDIDGHLVGGDGTVTGHFHVVGSGRRGGLLETTAVPEIRCQAERLAKRLTAQPGHAAR